MLSREKVPEGPSVLHEDCFVLGNIRHVKLLNFKLLFFLEPVKALSVKHESQIHTCSSTLWVGRWGSQVVEKLYTPP